MQIEKGKIRLRALTKEDAKTTWAWRNTKDMRHFYSGHPFYINPEKEEAWYAKILNSDVPLTTFGIEELENSELVGMAFLKDINMIHRAAEFAIFIGAEHAKGKGFAKEATLKCLSFAFRELNLHRVFLKVHEDNEKAIKLYEKCGFKREGLLRDSVYKDGRYRNEVVMSVLESEYDIDL